MTRTIVALVLEVLLAVVVALLVGALGQWPLTGDLPSGVAESARLLFLFMDVGLAVWLIVLIVLVARNRALPGVGVTLLAAIAGVALNAIIVLVVGFVQGGWAPLYIVFAIEAGIAFLIAVLVVAPIIQRLFRPEVKPPTVRIPPA